MYSGLYFISYTNNRRFWTNEESRFEVYDLFFSRVITIVWLFEFHRLFLLEQFIHFSIIRMKNILLTLLTNVLNVFQKRLDQFFNVSACINVEIMFLCFINNACSTHKLRYQHTQHLRRTVAICPYAARHSCPAARPRKYGQVRPATSRSAQPWN